MYKYKRGINNIDEARQVEYVLSNGIDTCLCMSACCEARKPYNGLYIKDGKIIIENIIESIKIKDKVYSIGQLETATKVISSLNYIESIDLKENKIVYDIGKLTYTKSITFSQKYKVLCIEYNVKNKVAENVLFKSIVMATYRDLYEMKDGSFVNFNQRKLANGLMINLSVMNNENVVLQSNDMKFNNKKVFLNNVKHDFVNLNGDKDVYTEDLLIPGSFEVTIKPNEERKIRIYISSKEEKLNRINQQYIENELNASNEIILSSIDENFVELRDLALSISNLDLKENIISSLPYDKDYNKIIVHDNIKINTSSDINKLIIDMDAFINIIRSIDGQYLTFNKINKANRVLLKIRRYIKNLEALNIKEINFTKKFILLKLWYVEEINNLLKKENNLLLYFDIVKDIVYDAIKNRDLILDEIKFVALFYNAIKIYDNMLTQKEIADIIVSEQIEFVEKLINEKFWCENKRILKRNVNDIEEVASVDMIYTISLSYPCLIGDLSIKLLDTIFKELYTPYGLRRFSKNSQLNDGLIYPKYMTHFVKANLRQNGITTASQKIAYNMVKELLQDINKNVNGGVKKVYHEKGLNINNMGYDLLTNAELIRLYNMLS